MTRTSRPPAPAPAIRATEEAGEEEESRALAPLSGSGIAVTMKTSSVVVIAVGVVIGVVASVTVTVASVVVGSHTEFLFSTSLPGDTCGHLIHLQLVLVIVYRVDFVDVHNMYYSIYFCSQ